MGWPPRKHHLGLGLGFTRRASGLFVPQDLFWQDNFDSGNLNAWDGSGQGFVWKDAVNFNWHADNALTFSGSGYSARGHYRTTGITSPHGTPSLSQVAGGALAARTYFVKVVYVQPNTPSSWINMIFSNQGSIAISLNNLCKVTSPAAGETLYYYNVYAGTVTGDANLFLQNASPIAIGTDWTEPTSGLANLGAYPGSFSPDSTSQTRQFLKWPRPDVGLGLHTFTRFRLYLKSPETGGQKIQLRKLHRIGSDQHNGDTLTWEGILNAHDTDNTGSVMEYGNQGDGLSQQLAFSTASKLAYDTWYTIELEEQLNDPPSASNAVINLWVTPQGGATTLWGANAAFRVRGSTDVPIGSIKFGDQVQRNTGLGDDADELRYFDDVMVTNYRIGV